MQFAKMRDNYRPNPNRRPGFYGYVIRMRCFYDRVVTDPHAFLNVNAAPSVQPDAKASGPRCGASNILQHPVLESRDEPFFAHTVGDSDLSHRMRNAAVIDSRSVKTLRIPQTMLNQVPTFAESALAPCWSASRRNVAPRRRRSSPSPLSTGNLHLHIDGLAGIS